MTPRRFLIACSLLGVGCATTAVPARAPTPSAGEPATTAPDPTTTDPDKYQVVLENDCVRVLRYHDQPGALTQTHHHRNFVMVPLAPFERELIFPDGRHAKRAFKQGEAIWVPAQTHAGHNIGTADTDVLLVEVKTCPAASP